MNQSSLVVNQASAPTVACQENSSTSHTAMHGYRLFAVMNSSSSKNPHDFLNENQQPVPPCSGKAGSFGQQSIMMCMSCETSDGSGRWTLHFEQLGICLNDEPGEKQQSCHHASQVAQQRCLDKRGERWIRCTAGSAPARLGKTEKLHTSEGGKGRTQINDEDDCALLMHVAQT